MNVLQKEAICTALMCSYKNTQKQLLFTEYLPTETLRKQSKHNLPGFIPMKLALWLAQTRWLCRSCPLAIAKYHELTKYHTLSQRKLAGVIKDESTAFMQLGY